MKSATKLVILLILLAALVIPTTAFASSPQPDVVPDKVILGGTYTLESGQTLDGNLAVFGGTASLEQDSRVTGDVVLVGGTLDINGEVDGGIILIGGTLFLGDNALVHGDVSTLGGNIHRSANARIEGRIHTGTDAPFQFSVPQGVFNGRPEMFFNFHPITDTLWFMFRTLALAALAMLVVLFMPNPTVRVANTIVAQPIISGGLGLLTTIIAPIMLVLLAITIILIPVSLVGILLLIAAGLFGWVALGLEVGKRIAALFKTEWPLAVAAGIGTFVMSLVVNGIGFIPCVGWLAPFAVSILGLGGVILTRFGLRNYPPYTPVSSTPVSPVQIYPTSGGNVPPTPPSEL
jgi:hypothetical protein